VPADVPEAETRGHPLDWHQVLMNSRTPAPRPFTVRTQTFKARDPGRRPPLLLGYLVPRRRRRVAARPLLSPQPRQPSLRHLPHYAPRESRLPGRGPRPFGSRRPGDRRQSPSFIANRVPDARLLLNFMLAGAIPCPGRSRSHRHCRPQLRWLYRLGLARNRRAHPGCGGARPRRSVQSKAGN
jgi:hypothetical protein